MDAFRQQRTWERARRLSLSQLACLGRHTMTGLIYTCGRQFLDWSADYRLCSKDRWDPEALFVPVVRGILEFLPPTAPVVAALDDTILRKTGTKTPGVAYRRDPLSPRFHVNFIRGQRFIQLSGLLPAGNPPGPARAIPLRFKHVPPVPKPKRSAPPEAWKAYREECRIKNLSTHGIDIIRGFRKELDQRHHVEDRPLVVAVDGSYTNKTVLKGLPQRTTVVGRIRKDAKLFYPPRDEDQPAVGNKRKYGDLAPTPEQLRQDPNVPWQEVQAFGSGKMHTFRVKTIAPVLWKKAGFDCPLRLMVIAPVGYRPRKGSKLLYRQPAYLICTDPDLALDEFLQYYLWRWDVEVNHRDEKQIIGVGEAQVRSPKSVDRQPALAVVSYATLLLASVKAFGFVDNQGTMPPPKWRSRRPKKRLSTQELIQQLRKEVWAYAIDQLESNSDDFVSIPPAYTKSLKLNLPLTSAVLYANTG
jgi:hypothetical protein